MYSAVKDAVELARPLYRRCSGPGNFAAVHALFRERGFETGIKKGRRQGFFHGVGMELV